MNQKGNAKVDIEKIALNFKIKGEFSSIESYGSGHINDTFCLINEQLDRPYYLLQRINHHVFPNVPSLMKNIVNVCKHLKAKVVMENQNPEEKVITLIGTKDGLDFYKDESGNYWRMYLFMKDTKSYDVVATTKQAKEGGKAFGRFQSQLSDLNPNLLAETIPDFHNIEKRLHALKTAIKLDKVNRVKEVQDELEFIKAREIQMSQIQKLGDSGELNKRIIHNDTKFNNILFDREDNVQCIIDLDTVMPGFVAFDFGDAIRTIINSGAEDEKDLDRITLNIPLFEAFAQGYLEEAVCFLTEKEIETLEMGIYLLPYMQGVRFLTDYIEGDVYFKINFENHNLQRARAQFELLKKLENEKDNLKAIILRTVESCKNRLAQTTS